MCNNWKALSTSTDKWKAAKRNPEITRLNAITKPNRSEVWKGAPVSVSIPEQSMAFSSVSLILIVCLTRCFGGWFKSINP